MREASALHDAMAEIERLEGLVRQVRAMDECDVAGQALRWIEEVAHRRGLIKEPHVEITRSESVTVLWHNNRPVAIAVLLRDTWNHTVGTFVEIDHKDDR